MKVPSDQDIALALRSRRVAIVLIAGALIFVLGEAIGAYYAVPGRWMGLFEIAMLAVMGWAIWETVTIWRLRRDKE
ncbi:hypothetical protein JSE7799_00944 [Jannaschia seosinensis]|uniref:Uncharacterized protein n=1 Tax=Jannaschia seosinensis TaxID=313367 RepID=A0A0M7B7Q3_9RHOB|nr:DUF5337 family protein [Jannaschia seosinensis]CUH32600.1 hypothetical protein JSE7799_00944 [Jannaschia seosinensis]